MAFFQFGRKVDLAKEYSLAEIPVFSSLTPAEHRLIEKKARLVEYKRGDVVYEEGTVSEAFYAVISGRFRLYLKGKVGREENTLLYFYRGDHFGETSLLTGRMHSGTVEAKRDGLLLRLEKDDFLQIMAEMPAISLHLNRSLGHRLTKQEDSTHRHEVRIAAFYSRFSSRAAFQFWLDLSGVLTQETKRKTVLVDLVSPRDPFLQEEFQSSLPSFNLNTMEPSREGDLKPCLVKHAAEFNYLHVAGPEDRAWDERKLSALLTFLTYRFDYLMLRLPGEINDSIFKSLKQSDVVYVHATSEELSDCAETVKEFQRSFGFSKNEIRAIVTKDRNEKMVTFEKKQEILGLGIFSLLPNKEDEPDRYGTTLRYIAKEFAGTLLGLALGSGAAYGLAHIGVLRVLEREGILPDIISGSSIGALVGGLWGAGYSADEMEKLAQSIDKKTGFFKLLGFQDMSIAHWGFFKGNQASRFLEGYLGDRTFQDLKIPVKILAANLFTSESIVFETGRVVDAIRASISIPGIFRPFHYQGKYLIDGGVVDPLPVRLLAAMGVKKIIAVNVLPGSKDRVERNLLLQEIKRKEKEMLARRNIIVRMLYDAFDKVSNRYAVNIFNVIMSTIQTLEYEMAESYGHQADILIHPIVRDAHWAEFYSPDKFIKMGEEKTLQQMEEIKRLLVE